MKKVLLITIALTLAGCAASVMKTWVGHEEVEVLASWGAPDRTARAGGKTIHTWDGRVSGAIVCTSTFVINADGIIEGFSTDC